jgi:OHCU decarboxylase
MSEEAFVAVLEGVVEHSPWVARAVYRDHLGDALEAAIRSAPVERQLALVRAHPELSSGEDLTAESAREQAGAGLDRGGGEQRALNAAYRERFGFPYVVCVREHTPDSILAWGSERLERSREEELETAIGEIAKIARLRLKERA